MAHKTLVNGTAYEISGGKTQVDGTGYSIGGGRTLVNGTGYGVSFGTPVNKISVGSSVYMNVNGVRTEFIVVNQGIPSGSSRYDSSCNGTWLMMKNIYENRTFGDSSDYSASSIHTYLNGTFLNRFDSNIKSIIKQVKLPYSAISTVQSGANGMLTKVFLLCAYEIGWAEGTTYMPADGACLSYFKGADNSKRIANYNGTATKWWTRSSSSGYSSRVWYCSADGRNGTQYVTDTAGVRPALILPSNAKINKAGDLVA